jgi:hypothetical protein
MIVITNEAKNATINIMGGRLNSILLLNKSHRNRIPPTGRNAGIIISVMCITKGILFAKSTTA